MPSWPVTCDTERMERPDEGPETNTEALRNEKARNNSKSELVQNRLNDGPIDNAYDIQILRNYFKLRRIVFGLYYMQV